MDSNAMWAMSHKSLFEYVQTNAYYSKAANIRTARKMVAKVMQACEKACAEPANDCRVENLNARQVHTMAYFKQPDIDITSPLIVFKVLADLAVEPPGATLCCHVSWAPDAVHNPERWQQCAVAFKDEYSDSVCQRIFNCRAHKSKHTPGRPLPPHKGVVALRELHLKIKQREDQTLLLDAAANEKKGEKRNRNEPGKLVAYNRLQEIQQDESALIEEQVEAAMRSEKKASDARLKLAEAVKIQTVNGAEAAHAKTMRAVEDTIRDADAAKSAAIKAAEDAFNVLHQREETILAEKAAERGEAIARSLRSEANALRRSIGIWTPDKKQKTGE